MEKPDWIKIRFKQSNQTMEVEDYLHENQIHTVCSSAICPNRDRCFNDREMTFLILGPYCTRGCLFCSVDKTKEKFMDFECDAQKVISAIEKFKLRYVTLTSPTRDDLPDGGASVYADLIERILKLASSPKVEALVPDFLGDKDSIDLVLRSNPSVFAHNLETIPRLYCSSRRGADWERSIEILRHASKVGHSIVKTAFIAGLGETIEELTNAMQEARNAGAQIVVIGQYLRPTKSQMPVQRYVTPDEFKFLEDEGYKMGYKVSLAGPFYRSSYKAAWAYEKALENG